MSNAKNRLVSRDPLSSDSPRPVIWNPMDSRPVTVVPLDTPAAGVRGTSPPLSFYLSFLFLSVFSLRVIWTLFSVGGYPAGRQRGEQGLALAPVGFDQRKGIQACLWFASLLFFHASCDSVVSVEGWEMQIGATHSNIPMMLCPVSFFSTLLLDIFQLNGFIALQKWMVNSTAKMCLCDWVRDLCWD